MQDVSETKKLVAETGIMLLERKLVARTWGNISARLDEGFMAISPSGLDYASTTAEDISTVKLSDLSWEGKRKPSSEKGIHAAAYNIFPDVNFVIHTHQKFASALSLGGFDNELLNEDEKSLLGNVETASYGLPGTKRLAANVVKALSSGSKVILLAHHGAVICGKDRDDALLKAVTLEEVCRKQIKGFDTRFPAGMQYAALGLPLKAQLDDMAQMIGPKIPIVSESDLTPAKLKKHGALIVKGRGIQVYSEDPDDKAALSLLTEKAAAAALHTRAIGLDARLSGFDSALMRTVYKYKYSKKKRG